MRDRINAALKEAIKSDDEPRVAMLRLIVTAVRDRDNQSEGGEGGELTDQQIRDLLATMIRQREKSVRDYQESGRLQLAEAEQAEIAILNEFLPRPLSQKEVQKAVAAAIRETGASSIRDMGKVMSTLKQQHPGRIDFHLAGREVKAALG